MIRFAVMLLLSGCATTGGGAWSSFDDGSLGGWVERVAAPELAQLLSTHPRFQSEPVRVAVMRGDSVAVRSDALSVRLRDDLHARLLEVPGLAVAVRDTEPACDTPVEGYLLGLELTRVGTQQAQAQLRLYDVVERRWVSGFHARWRGQLDPGQRRLADRVAVSERARGTRELPFGRTQSDLLAARLAASLACELRLRGDDENVIAPASHRGAALLAANLAGSHGMRIAATGQYALDTRVHEVDDGLYQVWAVLTPSDRALRSYTSNVYASAPLLRAVSAPGDGSDDSAVSDEREPIVSRLAVVAPPVGRGCGRAGERPRGVTQIDAGDCFAIEFAAESQLRFFVVSRDADGDYVRVYPADCTPGGIAHLGAGRHRFPARGVIGWDRRGGEETFLVIGATQAAAGRVSVAVNKLPSACERGRRLAQAGWRRQLDALIQRQPSEVSLETVQVRHVAGLVRR